MWFSNPQVVGSIPTGGAALMPHSLKLEHSQFIELERALEAIRQSLK